MCMDQSAAGASMARDLAPTTGRVTESRLVERARAGDHDAFALLVDARVEPTFRTAMAILGNEADARDATQEIFLRAWTHMPELRDPAMFPAWLGRIVVNTCRSAIRGRKRRQVHEIPAGAFLVDGEWIGPAAGTYDDRMTSGRPRSTSWIEHWSVCRRTTGRSWRSITTSASPWSRSAPSWVCHRRPSSPGSSALDERSNVPSRWNDDEPIRRHP